MQRSSVFSSAALSAVVLLGLLAWDAAAQQKTLGEQLVGAWTFVASTGKLADGSPAWGSHPKGLLIFTENGRYSSMIVRSDVPKFAANNRMKGTPDEDKAAVHGGIGGFGTYRVDEAREASPSSSREAPTPTKPGRSRRDRSRLAETS